MIGLYGENGDFDYRGKEVMVFYGEKDMGDLVLMNGDKG